MYGRTTFLALEDLHARLEGTVIVDWRSSKVLSSISSIPNDGNSGKAGKHGRSVVHGTRFNRERNGHAEDDDGEDDPDDANAIDDGAKLAQRVGRVLNDLSASHHVDSDRDTIGGRQTDGGDTSEGVESSRRAKVDASEDAVNDGREDESIDRHVKAVVDLTPELVSRNGTISSKSVGAARCSGKGTNACEHENAKNKEEETEATSSRTGNNLEQGTDRLGVGDGEKHLNIGKDEENGDEVNNSGDTGGSDGEDDGLGNLTFGVLDLFAHGSDHAVASQDISTYWLGIVSDRLIERLGIRTLQQSHEERPACRPATCRSIIVSKDELSRATRRCHSKQCDDNDDDTRAGPVNADLVDKVQVPRTKSVDQSTDKHHSPEAQDRLPCIRDKILIEDGNGAKDKLRTRKIDRKCNGPISHEREPAIDKADDRSVARRAEHGAPVIHAAGRWEHGADLGERGGDAHGDERHEDPAPENGDSLAVGQGDVHCRRETEGDGHDGEGQAEDAQHAEVSRELSLVAQTGEGLIGVAAFGGRLHDGQQLQMKKQLR